MKEANILQRKMFVARRAGDTTMPIYAPITCLAHCTTSLTRGAEIS